MATLYVSPYLVANSQNYTKHYYAGSERVASKLGGGGIANITTPIVNTDYKRNAWQTPYANLWNSSLNIAPPCSTYFYSLLNAQTVQSSEPERYFYHPDHLGSASWVTDSSGKAIQHLQYLPFGETRVDQRKTSWSTRYSFSAKEKDEESGYGYFGARYYDSDISIWLSVDPMASKYPGLTPYNYCANNPMIIIDPNGEEGIVISGQPGTHTNKEHFLANGLDRAQQAMNKRQSSSEGVTWMIFDDGSKENGHDPKMLDEYKKKAADLGINVMVTSNEDDIVDYVNNKNGGDSRANDKVTSLFYVGHATPGDLDVGYPNSGYIDADQFKSSAFASGAWIDVVGGCNTGVKGNLLFEKSVVDDFANRVDSKSTVKGSSVKVDYSGGVLTNQQLLRTNKGKEITKHGKN
jgi:RHS repeat-associated protein